MQGRCSHMAQLPVDYQHEAADGLSHAAGECQGAAVPETATFEHGRGSPLCPKCRYGLSGESSLWKTQCPLRGVCPECGTQFQWLNAFRRQRRIRWFVETAESKRRCLLLGVLTWIKLWEPSAFWSDAALESPPNVRIALRWLLASLLGPYVFAGLIRSGAVVFAMIAIPFQARPRLDLFLRDALLWPWCQPDRYYWMRPMHRRLGESFPSWGLPSLIAAAVVLNLSLGLIVFAVATQEDRRIDRGRRSQAWFYSWFWLSLAFGYSAIVGLQGAYGLVGNTLTGRSADTWWISSGVDLAHAGSIGLIGFGVSSLMLAYWLAFWRYCPTSVPPLVVERAASDSPDADPVHSEFDLRPVSGAVAGSRDEPR